nr:unnamed protein product [Callosobruchus analis]
MSTSGIYIPPMQIFPWKNMTRTLMKGAPSGSIGTCHPSGYIQTKWFNHFDAKTKPTADDPVLLIFGGLHAYTKNIEVIEIARKNVVTVVNLPPHTADKLQPLGKSFVRPLKHYYSQNMRQFMLHSERPLGPYDIAELTNLESFKAWKGQSVKISQNTSPATPSISEPVAATQDLTPSARTWQKLTFWILLISER